MTVISSFLLKGGIAMENEKKRNYFKLAIEVVSIVADVVTIVAAIFSMLRY